MWKAFPKPMHGQGEFVKNFTSGPSTELEVAGSTRLTVFSDLSGTRIALSLIRQPVSVPDKS
jgi:hypothetical protein